MKAMKVLNLTLLVLTLSLFVFFLVLTPPSVNAQDLANLESEEQFNQEELAQMLAPIALYPDALLSQILMAATYPIEVIEADRWIKGNQHFDRESHDDALLDKDWDPSVKSLCHFPSSLALMSDRIAETTDLGNAFLAQESDVLNMVQKLRAEARAHGHLNTTSEQNVVVKKETIIIEPPEPGMIYVPYYDPYYVYGSWRWSSAYPPYYWGPAGINIGARISYRPAIFFGVSFLSWSYFDWPHRSIYINVHKRPRYVRHERWVVKPGRWSHLPSHRRGVAYRDRTTARKYGQSPSRPTTFQRDHRGQPERNRDKQMDSQTRPQRYHQEQQRVERKMKDLDKASHDKRTRQPTATIQQKTDRVNTGKTERFGPEGNPQKRGSALLKQQNQRQVDSTIKNQEEISRGQQTRVKNTEHEQQVSPYDRFKRAGDTMEEERPPSDRDWKGRNGEENGSEERRIRKWQERRE